MLKEYPSNLSRDQFDLFSDLLPPAKAGGRPRTVDVYAVINAILYVLVEGVRWRALPGDFPPWPTVYTYFRNWRQDGTWQRIHDRLREWYRIEHGRQPSPSEAIIDSQSVKSAAGVNEAVGFDAGKQIKGRKRFLAVETLGLVMMVFVTAASTPEREGAKTLLTRLKALEARSIERLVTIWADGGFSGQNFLQWVMDTCRWVLQVVLRPKQTKGFQVVKKRWVVERTFGWLMHCRRLVRDYEQLPETSETFIYLAMIRIMVRRLA